MLTSKELIEQKQNRSAVRLNEFLEYIQAKFDNSMDISITVFKDEMPNYYTYPNLFRHTLEELGYHIRDNEDTITIKAL
jgi:hypothetical protein